MSTLTMNPEYSEEFEDKPLPLKLYSEDDEEDELWIKKRLEVLVNGDITPSQTAIEFDTTITEESNRRHGELMKRPDPRRLTPEERAEGVNMYRLAPNPRGDISTTFLSIARLCSAFPPYHPGQTRIVEFLKALRALPRHEVHAGCPPEDHDDHYAPVILWSLEEGNWEAVAELFDYEIVSCYPPYRWRNYNSAMARLTSSNLIDCGFLSSLGFILPSSHEYPDLEKRPIDGPNKIGNYIVGAAQWIMWPDQCFYVYQQSKQFETVSGSRQIWSMEYWKEWKRQFAFVAGDERFAQKYRDVAERSYRQMLLCEDEKMAQ